MDALSTFIYNPFHFNCMYLILSFCDQLIYVLQITSKIGEYYMLRAFVKPEPLYTVRIDYLFLNLYFS